MAIAHLGTDGFNDEFSSGATVTSHNVASSGGFVLAFLAEAQGHDISAVSYGGQAMTKAIERTRSEPPTINFAVISGSIWYLYNPPTGAQNVVITRGGGSVRIKGCVSSFSGVKTTSQLDATASAQGQNTDSVGLTVAEADELFVGMFMTTNNSPTPDSGQSELFNSSGSNPRTSAAYTIPGTSGAKTMAWTDAGNADTVLVAAAFFSAPITGPTGVKTVDNLAIASVKTVMNLAIGSVKTIA